MCNSIYTIISKIIALRFKNILSKLISTKQFGFLNGRKIHDAIRVAQEGMHTIKTQKLSAMILKLDIYKAYD
jgi:retron-type reverse transcriptase